MNLVGVRDVLNQLKTLAVAQVMVAECRNVGVGKSDHKQVLRLTRRQRQSRWPSWSNTVVEFLSLLCK